MNIALKYCGSCNPDVELAAVVRSLRALVEGRAAFVPLASGEVDIVVILNGCGVACADRPDVRARAPSAIVVAGESVAFWPVPAEEIAEQVAQMIVSGKITAQRCASP